MTSPSRSEVDKYFFICIFLLLLRTSGTSDIQTAEHRGEYCDTETFKAECQEGWIILLTSAWYGRMRMGRCVGMYLGHMGCKKDVLTTADKRCSGKRVCEIRIPDAEFESFRPCIKELKTYLEANYVCVKAETTSSEECKSSNELKVTSNSGFLASIVTSDTPFCDGVTHAWVIRALKGQRVNLTLYDFALDKNFNPRGVSTASIIPLFTSPPSSSLSSSSSITSSIASSSSSSSSTCMRYGMIEDGGNLAYEICGGQERTRHLYLSYTHLVKVWMTAGSAPTDLKRFAIHFEVIGCSDPTNSSHFWFRRKYLSPANNTSSSSTSSSASQSSSSSASRSSSSSSSSSLSSPLVLPPSPPSALPYSYHLRIQVSEVGVWGCHHTGEVLEAQCDLVAGRWTAHHINCSNLPLTTEIQIGDQEVELLLRHSNKRSRDKNTGNNNRGLLSNRAFLLIIIISGVTLIVLLAPAFYVFFRLKRRKRTLKQKQRHSVLVQENIDTPSMESHNLVDNFSRQSSGTFHLANKAEIKPLINQSVSASEASYRQVSAQKQLDRFQAKDNLEHKMFLPPSSISSGEKFQHDMSQQALPYCHQFDQLCHQQQQHQRLPVSSLVSSNPYHTLRQQGEKRHQKNVTWCLQDPSNPSALADEFQELSYLSSSTTLPKTTHHGFPIPKFKTFRPVSENPIADIFYSSGNDANMDSLPTTDFSRSADVESMASLLDSQSNASKLNHMSPSSSISDVTSQSKSSFTKKTLLTDV